MKFIVLLTFVFLPLAWLSSHKAFSQSVPDAVQAGTSKFEIIHQASSVSDSLQLKLSNKLSTLDSVQMRLHQNNSISRLNYRLDSIHGTSTKRYDSLMLAYKNKIGELDSLSSSLRKEWDSLTSINMSGNGVAEKLDSVANLQRDITARFETKLQEIKDQASSKITRLNLPPEVSERARAITVKIEGLKIPGSNFKIPNPDGFQNPLANFDGLGKVEDLAGFNSSDVAAKVGNANIPHTLGDANQLTKATGKIYDVSNISEKLSGYANGTGQLPGGNIDDVEHLSRVAEEKLVEASGITEIEKQTESFDRYKEMVTAPPDQDSLKALAIAQVTQMAVNHFAGKEQHLQEAIETVAKYKNKYASVPTINELPKKCSNQMRDKPLIKRIVPGIAIQVQKEGDDLLLDFNPYVAYRFTGKINSGLGWNQRVAFNTNYHGFNPDPKIFGPRIFGEYNLRKGFSPRVELEMMNANVPAITTSDPLRREWVCGAFIGLKKEYRFFKNVKGTFLVMTRLFNPNHKSPYADVLNVRFGFEFPMKSKNAKIARSKLK